MLLPIGTIALVGMLYILSGSYTANWSFNWEGIRPGIKDTALLIEQDRSVADEFVGYSGKTPQHWLRRNWLMNNAKEVELTRLIEHPSGAVKVAAYEGLVRMPSVNAYKLMHKALRDTTTFFYFHSGCTGQPMMIGEYLVQNVIPISDRLPPLPPEKAVAYNLSKSEVETLRSLYNDQISKKEYYFEKSMAKTTHMNH